jgi:hypothetical protein
MKYYLLITIFFYSSSIFSQNKILVAERTFKANKTEDFYYAFAEGDQIIFDFEMIKGKEIKEIEIIEYPNSSKFMDYETKKIKNQVIQVPKNGIYIFRFKEKGIGKKVCKFKVQRIPFDETTASFNTSVLFETQSKTTYETKRKKVIDQQYYDTHTSGGSITVDAQKLGLTSNTNYYQFTIPQGTLHWTYRIGVAQEVAKAQQKDAIKFQKATANFAKNNIATFPETALAAYALGYIPRLTISSAGEDVDYSLVDYNNLSLFKADKSYNSWIHQKGISVDVKKITSQNGPIAGTYYFTLRNDNQIDNIDVKIEIVTVKQVTTYKWQTYKVPNTVTWEIPYMADEYYKRKEVAKIYESIQNDIKKFNYDAIFSKIKKLREADYDESSMYSNICYNLIVNYGKFAICKDILEYGLEKYPNDLYIQGNLAHCYLFTGDVEKAKEIYLKYQYERLSENLTWKDAVKKDFDEFRKKGKEHPEMKKIEMLLNI